MRTEKEIREFLEQVKSKSPIPYNTGWIDALNFVLSNPYDRENLSKELIDALEELERLVYDDFDYKHRSGGYVNAEIVGIIEIPNPDNYMEDIEVYDVDVEHGIDGETHKDMFNAYIRVDNNYILFP